MPEGDTVWRTARTLDRALSGQVLTSAELRVPEFAASDLTGARVLNTQAKGKHLLTRLDLQGELLTLHTHLKMEGSWHLYKASSKWKRPAYQARAILRTDEWQAVGFDLGLVELVKTSEEASVVGHLGPDPLTSEWDPTEALARLRSVPEERIADALLDQRLISGLGNVFRAEVCFLRGLGPDRLVKETPSLEKVVDISARLLQANKDRDRRTTTGIERPGQELWVYGRAGKPCRRCGTQIVSREQGPVTQERIVYWCPTCQR
jgi:endonuclease VIII